jgi:hypothetical protein
MIERRSCGDKNMTPPTEEEFRKARSIANEDDHPMSEGAYQICRWFRGQMFLRDEAETALTALRATDGSPPQ